MSREKLNAAIAPYTVEEIAGWGDVGCKRHWIATPLAQYILALEAKAAAVKESLTTGEQPVADGVDWKAKFNELDVLVNNPHTDEFLRSVQLEAAHQQLRWGSSHDAGKNDADWFWLIGYLAGKAIRPDQTSEKRLHHVITTAAACLNWHARLTGQHDGKASMRPGIGPEKQQAIDGLAAQRQKAGGE